jgi:small subunit ribosomal protein S7
MFINRSSFPWIMANVLVFNRWSTEGIKVNDLGVAPYMNLDSVIVPKTGARYAGNKFHKSRILVVERLINKVMVTGHKGKKHLMSSGHQTGKSYKVYDLVEKAFEIVESKTKQNPLAVFVKAVENAAPREEIVTIEYGGARYPKAVECAPQRRVDFVLRLMAQGAKQKSFNSKKSFESALADEIVAAYQLSPNSLAISKKLEVERQADASR